MTSGQLIAENGFTDAFDATRQRSQIPSVEYFEQNGLSRSSVQLTVGSGNGRVAEVFFNARCDTYLVGVERNKIEEINTIEPSVPTICRERGRRRILEASISGPPLGVE